MAETSDNLRGALFMMGAMTAFTVNDAFMKWLGQDLPFFQILFLRSLAVTLVLGVLLLRKPLPAVPKGDRRVILIRTLAEIAAAYFFISALFHMPIANVTAVIQALPLTVTLGAALVLREPVGWRRFTAIGVGLIGVLLIVRPGTAGFDGYSVYALAAVACVTVRDLAARRVSRAVPSMVIAFAAAFGVLLFSGIGAIFTEWHAMSPAHVGALGGAVLFILGGYVFSVSAMRVGEIGVVAPFRYSALVVALILGLLVFGEWPEPLTLIGAGIVVATGLYTLWRERHRARRVRTGLRVR